LETARFDGFQLLLHRFHIGGQRQFTAIVEDQVIGWVDALQFEHLAHRGAQRGELGFVQQGHDEQGGTSIEVMPVAADAVAAPARA
jgi:hypothetical protein